MRPDMSMPAHPDSLLAQATAKSPWPDPSGPLTQERFRARLKYRLPGKENERLRRAIELDADAYGAHLIEKHARPGETWELGDGTEGGGAA